MKRSSDYLKVSLHGMTGQAEKMMAKYLEMCCNDIALVVEESKSDAEIVDVDLAMSKTFLEERLAQQPSKPIIALSLQDVSFDNVVHVKKPVDIPSIVSALKTVKKQVAKNSKKGGSTKIAPVVTSQTNKVSASLEINLDEDIKERKSPNKTGAKKVEAETIEIEIEKAANTFVGSVPKWTQRKKNLSQKTNKDRSSRDSEEIIPIELPTSEMGTVDDFPQLGDSPQLGDTPEQVSETSSVHLREIDRLLKELHDSSDRPNTSEPPNEATFSEKGVKGDDSKQKNNRKTIRYAFHPIEAKLKKTSVMGLNINQTVLVLNISSKGAIIELKKPLKLSGKTTLTIHFDSQNVFIIPARVVRKEGKIIYGLHFLNFQHDLTDFLVNSGRSFFFS